MLRVQPTQRLAKRLACPVVAVRPDRYRVVDALEPAGLQASVVTGANPHVRLIVLEQSGGVIGACEHDATNAFQPASLVHVPREGDVVAQHVRPRRFDGRIARQVHNGIVSRHHASQVVHLVHIRHRRRQLRPGPRRHPINPGQLEPVPKQPHHLGADVAAGTCD